MSRKTRPQRGRRGKPPLPKRLTWLWPATLGLGLVGAVALVIVFASVGGGGGSGPSVTPVAENTGESSPVASSQGGPSIDFPVTEVDFGQVPLNTEASYAFEFSNVGDAPLQIEDVQVKMLEGC